MEEAVTLPISSSITSIVFRNTPSLACLARTERRIWDCETAQRCQTNTRNTGLCITWWPEPSIFGVFGTRVQQIWGSGLPDLHVYIKEPNSLQQLRKLAGLPQVFAHNLLQLSVFSLEFLVLLHQDAHVPANNTLV